VLVIGAGPAGLAAARVLALAGVTVIVAEQRAFPARQGVRRCADQRSAQWAGVPRRRRDRPPQRSATGLEDAYRRNLERRFRARYRAYAVAQWWAASPSLLNLLPWRAAPGTFVQRELERLVAERGDPARLFSLAGLLKASVG